MNIVVTGASRGIGFSLTEQFLRDGHRVLAISRNIAPLKALAARMETDRLIVLSADLEQASAFALVQDAVSQHFARVDALVNNAGLLIKKPFQALGPDDFDRMFNVNVKAPFGLINALADRFANNAHIVNLGSMGGVQGSVKFAGLSLYSASKGALAILTESLAEELKPQGIKVNCLALGATATEMLNEAFPNYKAPVSADSMASFIAWFTLNGHLYFNGKIIPVSLTTP